MSERRGGPPIGPEGPSGPVSTRLPLAVREALRAEAEARGVSVHALVAAAVRAELARCGRYDGTVTSISYASTATSAP